MEVSRGSWRWLVITSPNWTNTVWGGDLVRPSRWLTTLLIATLAWPDPFGVGGGMEYRRFESGWHRSRVGS